MSRVQFFDSLPELEEAAAVVVVGTAGDQQLTRDISPMTEFTITEFIIESSLKAPDESALAESVTVRQFGSSDGEQAPPTPLLVTGERYLLFLSNSELPGDLASQYYVTGANAGVFQEDENSEAIAQRGEINLESIKFSAVDPSPEDVLPLDIDVSDSELIPGE